MASERSSLGSARSAVPFAFAGTPGSAAGGAAKDLDDLTAHVRRHRYRRAKQRVGGGELHLRIGVGERLHQERRPGRRARRVAWRRRGRRDRPST